MSGNGEAVARPTWLPLTRINVAPLREAKNLHTTVRPSRTARKAKNMSHATAQRKRKKSGKAQ